MHIKTHFVWLMGERIFDGRIPRLFGRLVIVVGSTFGKKVAVFGVLHEINGVGHVRVIPKPFGWRVPCVFCVGGGVEGFCIFPWSRFRACCCGLPVIF